MSVEKEIGKYALALHRSEMSVEKEIGKYARALHRSEMSVEKEIGKYARALHRSEMSVEITFQFQCHIFPTDPVTPATKTVPF